jgi:hypothetical protein
MAADDFDFGLETEGGLAAEVRKYYDVESTADAPSRVVSGKDGFRLPLYFSLNLTYLSVDSTTSNLALMPSPQVTSVNSE